jgi:hypothetical protein
MTRTVNRSNIGLSNIPPLLQNYLTMTKDILFVSFIHDPTNIMFNKYKYRQRVTGDSESEDEDTTFCKKYGKKEAGASYSFFVARKDPGDLEPMVEHVQVGKKAMEKDVDVRKNILLKKSQAAVLSLLGSIGVTFQSFDVSYLLSRDGYLNFCLDTLFLLCSDKKYRKSSTSQY